jgi:hypothetical protein
MHVLNSDSLDQLFVDLLKTPQWHDLKTSFNKSSLVFIVGNGGNLAVADHGAVDITRLSQKLAIAPGSGILATSIIGDNCIDTWFTNWISAHIDAFDEELLSKSCIIGVSSSGTASNIVSCLDFASSHGISAHILSARNVPPDEKLDSINYVEIGTDYYHTGEVISLLLFYQLIHESGAECPAISKKMNAPSFDRFVHGK